MFEARKFTHRRALACAATVAVIAMLLFTVSKMGPAQAAGLDEIVVAGLDRIAIESAGGNLGAATPLDGVVQRHDQRARWRKGGDEGHQQTLARLQR